MSHPSGYPDAFRSLLPSLSSSSLNIDQMSLQHLPNSSPVLSQEPDATRSLGVAVDRFPSSELPAHHDMTSAALSGKGLSSYSPAQFDSSSYPQQHKQLYVENVVTPVLTNTDLPPFPDHPLEPSHVMLHARSYLPEVLISLQRALQNDLVDVESSGYELRCTAHRFGCEIAFVVRVYSFSASGLNTTPALSAFCLEVTRLSGDGMEFNDIFRMIHSVLYTAGFVDASDGPAPDVPSSLELASTQSFDINYAEETLLCFKSMCLSPMGDTRREGLAGLSDLAMTENPVLMPLFVRLEVPQLLLNLLYVGEEDSYRSAVSGLASLAIHQDVSRFLAAQSVQRNVLLTLAGRLPIERSVTRSPAIIRHSIRLLNNMAAFLGRDLVQNCLAEAQLANAQISSEGNPEFVQRMRDLQRLTGGFGDSE